MVFRRNRNSARLTAQRRHAVVLTVTLAVLLPAAAFHGFLFHGLTAADCSHHQAGAGDSLCGDGVFPHEDDACGLCAVSWRWAPGKTAADLRAALPPLGFVTPTPSLLFRRVSTNGTLGPRAPPKSL